MAAGSQTQFSGPVTVFHDLLFRFLQQNDGQPSFRASENEFAALTEEEADRIEKVYGDVFGGVPDQK
ncbi:hypothetical protein GCM10007420_22070 [Glycocaulis albus]|uniref:Uncharacterized protein n=1 Tax=Glycocaulis albus TaxID=1382801 RepID=A0ABQ1XWZ4_9PROT|nr:hypothetical protein [Glycocaulis albus]GGH05184.1 hypothetical protein GCM10007420_22070 [Glycocaulis albus]